MKLREKRTEGNGGSSDGVTDEASRNGGADLQSPLWIVGARNRRRRGSATEGSRNHR